MKALTSTHLNKGPTADTKNAQDKVPSLRSKCRIRLGLEVEWPGMSFWPRACYHLSWPQTELVLKDGELLDTQERQLTITRKRRRRRKIQMSRKIRPSTKQALNKCTWTNKWNRTPHFQAAIILKSFSVNDT